MKQRDFNSKILKLIQRNFLHQRFASGYISGVTTLGGDLYIHAVRDFRNGWQDDLGTLGDMTTRICHIFHLPQVYVDVFDESGKIHERRRVHRHNSKYFSYCYQ